MELNKEFFRGLNTEKFPVSDEQQIKIAQRVFVSYDEPELKVWKEAGVMQWHTRIRLHRNDDSYPIGDLYNESLVELIDICEQFIKITETKRK